MLDTSNEWATVTDGSRELVVQRFGSQVNLYVESHVAGDMSVGWGINVDPAELIAALYHVGGLEPLFSQPTKSAV